MGVREYLIAEADKQQFLWNAWTGSAYQPLDPGSDGIFRSRCFPGLWLDPNALWSRDLPRLFAVLDQGLATPEHASFVERLAGRNR